MLSRRNIRVKVMQTLYSVESMKHQTKEGEPLKILSKKIEDTQELLTYLMLYITEIAKYAEKLAIRKAQKHLPTESDLSLSTRISGNTIIRALLENSSFNNAIAKFKTKYIIDENVVKNCFLQLAESDAYKEYISQPSREARDERNILEYIFENQMLSDENFSGEGEEKFIHWNDDMESVIGLVKNALSKPGTIDFLEMPGADKMAFAKDLLSTVMDKDEYCLELIKPKLKNWEAERIAVVDMLLLKMGVCEILYFETIPTKVTLNEYIDIAKEYSTEKSGHFVNGILDNILKDLVSQDKIQKKKFNKTI